MILSGAGLSAESGIRTFRESEDGLWEEYDVMEVCSVQGFAADRQKVLDFYDKRRSDIEFKEPNEAHKMIARVKARHPEDIVVITQNVDDMLERAGCEDLIHLHGTLTDLRCEDCGHVFRIGYDTQRGVVCPRCESDNVRHNVVMFGEMAPRYEDMIYHLNETELLIVIGTSGHVIDTAYYAQVVGNSVLNNIDVDEYHDAAFTKCIYEPATQAAAQIEEIIEDFLA